MSTLASVIVIDVFASIPAASIPGRLFFASDTGDKYRDNGATWDLLTQAQTIASVAGKFLISYDSATGLFLAAQPTEADLSLSDITTNNVSITRHGFAPKAPNDATKFLNGAGAYTAPGGIAATLAAVTHKFLISYDAATGLFVAAQPTEADLSLTDITTNDVSITRHGLAPKAPNDATKFLNGVGGYTVPPGTGLTPATLAAVTHKFLISYDAATGLFVAAQPTEADLSLSAITTNDVSITKHGFAPVLPNDATKFLNGAGGYTSPPGSGVTKYTTSWAAQTSVTVTHGLGTTAVIVQVYDAAGTLVSPESIVATSTTVVTLTFGAAFTGSVVVLG